MSEARDATAAEVGSTANHYQILARLATGGMAEIFLARGVSATGVERHCVLKRILRNRASDVSFVRMFLDEARLAAQLQHPNVAQVYDIGKLGDSYFFTMEYVHGETVRAILQRARSLRREIPLASVLTIVTGTAAGLHHAHDRIGMDGRPLQIVHRDVSPSNLMVSYEGTVKVVDFGVAKASDRAHETRSGTVKGKISYLSPEQARGTAIDRRSDLFSLGIVLWEMLTTERLYKRGSDFENMTAIVTEPPPPPSSRRSWIPAELDAITLKLLAKDPAARFQSGDELIEALEGFASRNSTMISPSALSRFLREMFGQRPEPWVELDTAEVPEGVTVTSEPIPGELAIPIADDRDLELGRVPKLVREAERSVPVTQLDDDHVLVTPLIGRAPTGLEPDLAPTTPHPKIASSSLATVDDLPPAPPTGPAMPVPAHHGSGPRNTMVGTGIPNRGSGPLPQYPETPSRGMPAEPSITGYPSAAASVTGYPHAVPADEPPPRSRIGWQLVTVIVVAAILGSLTMWLVMKRGGGEAPVVAAADAASAESIESVDAVAVEPVAVAADAAELEPVSEAAVAQAPPVDAAAVEPPVDAVVAAVEPAVDAAVVDEPPRQPERPRKRGLAELWEDRDFKEVVARCTRAFPTANADEVRCVLAACKLSLDGKARAFYGKVDRSRRKQLVGPCKSSGVDLDPPGPSSPPKKNPCEIDPLSCQH